MHPIQIIGNWGNNSYPVGYLNDVRIYDHALSAKKYMNCHLQKFLHYDFDNPFVEESDNLVSVRDITASGLTVNLTNGALTPGRAI